MLSTLLPGVFTLISVVAGSAQLPSTQPAKKNPYARLFPAPTIVASVRTEPQTASQTVCGMTVVDVDPKLDGKIRVPARRPSADYKIRRIVPSNCRK
jgi:hypothetical protein